MTGLPVAQVESLQRLHHEPGLRVNDLAARHRLASNMPAGADEIQA